MRLDIKMLELNLVESREKARALIMEGKVLVNGEKITKAGTNVNENSAIELISPLIPYVSRGGLKLEKALREFKIDIQGCTALDIGASTGGFTDCMLQNGAKKVFSIDVGYGQLNWRLRNDERVVVMERSNARNIAADWFNCNIEFASMDVSFISVKLIFPALYNCLSDNAGVVALIKPQFEAGRAFIEKHGVVHDKSVHVSVVQDIALFLHSNNFSLRGITYSPITGPKGNIEFLVYVTKKPSAEDPADSYTDNSITISNLNSNYSLELFNEKIAETVSEAHRVLIK